MASLIRSVAASGPSSSGFPQDVLARLSDGERLLANIEVFIKRVGMIRRSGLEAASGEGGRPHIGIVPRAEAILRRIMVEWERMPIKMCSTVTSDAGYQGGGITPRLPGPSCGRSEKTNRRPAR